MNEKTATFNPSDVYEAFVQQLLKDNPEYWATYSRKKQRCNSHVYRKKGNDVVEVMSIDRWMRLVKLYYLSGRKMVIEGARFRFGHRIGAIQARTISRNFKNKQINWAETKKQPLVEDPATGKLKRAKIIYYTSENYSRIAWEKLGSIPNETFYKFKPSKGNKTGKGFAREFSAALKSDPLLETRYKQFTDELSLS